MGELDTRDTAKNRARIISLAEAAKIIGTSYPTAVRLAESGELKAFRIRSSWRTSDAACDEFIRQQFRLQALKCQSRVQEK
ncbi:MAG: excisionase family DNA-binding protein [Eggerthellaceae bacterium]|nr:excisionase family DNA-binding protein [Eggerthellaceae bacterium]